MNFENKKATRQSYGEKLAELTGFINIVLPKFEDLNSPKDISDFYYALQDKNKFKETKHFS